MKKFHLALSVSLLFAAFAIIASCGSNGSGTSNNGGVESAANFKMPDTNQIISYTTTTGEDHDYTINSPSYADNGNGTITDNVTTLVWQKQDDGVTRTWADSTTYCDTLTLGGQTDWKLPSRIELVSLIDNGIRNPAINTTYFPNTGSSIFWSSTTYASNTSKAWLVYFTDGSTGAVSKTGIDSARSARCVRGGQ